MSTLLTHLSCHVVFESLKLKKRERDKEILRKGSFHLAHFLRFLTDAITRCDFKHSSFLSVIKVERILLLLPYVAQQLVLSQGGNKVGDVEVGQGGTVPALCESAEGGVRPHSLLRLLHLADSSCPLVAAQLLDSALPPAAVVFRFLLALPLIRLPGIEIKVWVWLSQKGAR